MAVTNYASGTQTAVVETEHILSAVNVVGTFTFHVDTVNMVDRDILELRIYQIILTGGTSRVAYITTFYGTQIDDDKIKISVPVSNELTDDNALKFTLKQTFGAAGRDFPWKVLKYA